jgi:hypothetical protein
MRRINPDFKVKIIIQKHYLLFSDFPRIFAIEMKMINTNNNGWWWSMVR